MDRRLIFPRGACTALTVAGMAVLLAGCAGGGGAASPSGLEDPPTSEVEAWADVVIAENQLGGASWVARDIVTLRTDEDAGVEKAIDVAQPEGEWLVEVACLSASGGAITVRLETHEGAEDAEVACSAPSDDPFAPATSLRFTGTGKALLTLGSDQSASAVYAVYPDGAGQR